RAVRAWRGHGRGAVAPSSPSLSLASAEECEPRYDVRRTRACLDLVDAHAPEDAAHARALGGDPLGIQGAHLLAARVNADQLARLRVTQHQHAGVRKPLLCLVTHTHRDHVVTLRDQLERLLPRRRLLQCPGGHEIAQHEQDAAMREQAGGVIECAGNVGSLRLRPERQHVADQAQYVPPALAWRHDVLDAIREDDEADAVVVADGRESEHGRDLRCQLRLEPAARAELLRARQVDQQHHRELSLLDVLLHVWHTDTRRDVPVDVAHVVTGLVLAHLGELHSLSAEDRVVLAGEEGRDEAARAQLDEPHLAHHVAWHGLPRLRRGSRGRNGRCGTPAQERQRAHGTSMAAKMRSTMSSDETSSASASKLVMTRWRSTSWPIAFTSSGSTYARPRRYA